MKIRVLHFVVCASSCQEEIIEDNETNNRELTKDKVSSTSRPTCRARPYSLPPRNVTECIRSNRGIRI